jgi:hypothetical protein
MNMDCLFILIEGSKFTYYTLNFFNIIIYYFNILLSIMSDMIVIFLCLG